MAGEAMRDVHCFFLSRKAEPSSLRPSRASRTLQSTREREGKHEMGGGDVPIIFWPRRRGLVLVLAQVVVLLSLTPASVGGISDTAPGIVFLKTHKTASSTVTALLHHLCVHRNVSCFVSPPPRAGIANRVHWDLREQWERKSILETSLSTLGTPPPLDVWPNHAVNHPFLGTLVPKSKGRLVTIVRDPVDRFFSACNFFMRPALKELEGLTSCAQFVIQAAKDVELEERWGHARMEPPLHDFYRVLNGMTLVLGGGRPAEEAYLDLVDQILAPRSNYTVMLFERLEESLVMFGEEHGLELSDLVHLPMKKGGTRKRWWRKTSSSQGSGFEDGSSSPALVAAAALHGPDVAVYRAAVQAHERRAAAFGRERLAGEVKKLAALNEATKRRCEGTVAREAWDEARWGDPYCTSLALDNVEWTNAVWLWHERNRHRDDGGAAGFFSQQRTATAKPLTMEGLNDMVRLLALRKMDDADKKY